MKKQLIAAAVAGLLGSAATVALAADGDRHVYLDQAARNPGQSNWPAPGDISQRWMDDRPGDYFVFKRPLITNPPNVYASEFSALDVNRDGYISPDESIADSRLHGATVADRNDDGLVDIAEYSAFESDLSAPISRATTSWPAPNVPQRVLDDRAGDYFVFKRPLITRTPDVHASRFSSLDVNGDGVLSQAELNNDALVAYHLGDLNGDGYVDLPEFSALEVNAIPTRHPSAEANWPPPPADASHPNLQDTRPGDYFVFKPPVAGQGLR